MSDELNAFREGFCEKAAELGCLPSELLEYHEILNAKQAMDSIKSAGFLSTLGSALGGIGKDIAYAAPGWYFTGLGLSAATGLGAGGLAGYLMNKGQEEVDPDSAIFKEELAKDDEIKKLHLIAKYHQAMDELQNPES